jgi:hypothetical protein
MVLLEEVWAEQVHFSEMLSEMNADLLQTTKTVVQKLKQDPTTVIVYPFKPWIQSSINLLASKLEPQEVSHVIRIVEDNKEDGFQPPLVTMVCPT